MSNVNSPAGGQISNKFLVKNRKNFPGSTLIELILYMGLLAIFIGVLTGLFGTAIDIQLGSQATNGVINDTNYILSKLQYDIQRAQSIVTPSILGTNSSSLVLKINNINHTYSKDSNGNLVYTNNAGPFFLNNYTASISAMTFTLVGNLGGSETSVKVDMTITSRVRQQKGQESQTISTSYALRKNL
jgi:hypothetical protein